MPSTRASSRGRGTIDSTQASSATTSGVLLPATSASELHPRRAIPAPLRSAVIRPRRESPPQTSTFRAVHRTRASTRRIPSAPPRGGVTRSRHHSPPMAPPLRAGHNTRASTRRVPSAPPRGGVTRSRHHSPPMAPPLRAGHNTRASTRRVPSAPPRGGVTRSRHHSPPITPSLRAGHNTRASTRRAPSAPPRGDVTQPSRKAPPQAPLLRVGYRARLHARCTNRAPTRGDVMLPHHKPMQQARHVRVAYRTHPLRRPAPIVQPCETVTVPPHQPPLHAPHPRVVQRTCGSSSRAEPSTTGSRNLRPPMQPPQVSRYRVVRHTRALASHVKTAQHSPIAHFGLYPSSRLRVDQNPHQNQIPSIDTTTTSQLPDDRYEMRSVASYQSDLSDRSEVSRQSINLRAQARLKAAEYEYSRTITEARLQRVAEEERFTVELAMKKLDAERAAVQADLDALNTVAKLPGIPPQHSADTDCYATARPEHIPLAPEYEWEAAPRVSHRAEQHKMHSIVNKMDKRENLHAVHDSSSSLLPENVSRVGQRRQTLPSPERNLTVTDCDEVVGGGVPRRNQFPPPERNLSAVRSEVVGIADQGKRILPSPERNLSATDCDEVVGGGVRRREKFPSPERNLSAARSEVVDIGGQQRQTFPSPERNLTATDCNEVVGGNMGSRQEANTLNQLADAIRHVTRLPAPLPIFSGDPREFLAFRASYRETDQTHKYSTVENMSRLRNALRGEAKEAVAARLYTVEDPEQIITTLERRFGRPETIISVEVQRMRDLPRLNDTNKDLNTLACRVENCVATVKTMHNQAYLYSPELVRCVLQKLTPLLKSKFNDYNAARRHENPLAPELETLSEFLCSEADKVSHLAAYDTTISTSQNVGRMPHLHRGPSKAAPCRKWNRAAPYTYTTKNKFEPQSCAHCHKDHPIIRCDAFSALSIDQRWKVIKATGTCFKCLMGKHRWSSCKARPCGIDGCRRPHHRLLHQKPNSKRNTNISQEADHKVEPPSVGCAKSNRRHAYLKIAPVTLKGPRGIYETFAMLDEGSTITLLENEAADLIGARGPESRFQLQGIGGLVNNTQRSRRVSLKIKGRGNHDWIDVDEVRTIDKIGLGTQTVDEEVIEGCQHLAELSEQLLYKDARPTLLIGQDNWAMIVSRELRSGRKNDPVASKTDLGWVLHGYRTAAVATFTTCHARTTSEDELHRLVRAHYDIEALGVAARQPRVPAEERALEILTRTTKQTTSGRYEVGLLWKEDKTEMPPNEHQAFTRLRSVERKMRADPLYEIKYRAKMKTLLEAGYAERCPPEPANNPTWYLPHFAVQNPKKPGKLRIVFDAAAKTSGISLNDCLLTGPDLLQPLLGVLLRFREGAVAVAGDIKEMFLRIIIREEDRDAQRFLWRDRPDEPPQHFRMNSMIFGAASSPCTALHIKNHNARAVTSDAATIEAIERGHYMDDALLSTNNEDEAASLVLAVTTTHAAGGFEICGWTSNKSAVLQYIDPAARGGSIVDLTASSSPYERTLGLIWNTESDRLAIDFSFHRVPAEVASGHRKPTKRQMLSLVMSIYDPLGLLTPITTGAKILLQRVWRSALEWDEELTQELHAAWTEWLAHLQGLRHLQIPRHYGTRADETAELHVFCDASSDAYAAVAYWRIPHEDDSGVKAVLVASKSRVAPLRPVSVPRLELQAALLGVRLAATINEEHRMQTSSITYWSDSKTALSWIREDARRYKPFVAHRVAEVQDRTHPHQWRWVPSNLNSADLATRSPPQNFNAEHWWFTGPAFLKQSRKEWPVEESPSSNHSTSEDKAEQRSVFVVQAFIRHATLPELGRFSKWIRLIRTTGRVLQFVDLLRERAAKTGAIVRRRGRRIVETTIQHTHERTYIMIQERHLREAENMWTKYSQEISFAAELTEIRAGKNVNRNSRLATLAPHLDGNGILRLTGRIGAATDVDPKIKDPVLLDGGESYTRLLIAHYHSKYHHGNHGTVVNEIRQRYWILRLRSTLRSVINRCQWCRVHKGTPCLPPPGDLPRARLVHHQRPFTATGIDYFGPIEVTIGRRKEKRWGALFTCLTTRAIHIELAASLSADSMLLALRRMVARRGMPTEIYTDNGTNFIGARRELEEAYEELLRLGQVAEQQLGVQWRTIPPGAPNMGGAWERMVRSVKTALTVTLRERAPREEVLATLLLEVEHVVNSRPLTHVSAHPGDEEALTPNHFLIGTSSGAPVPILTTNRDLVGKATWRTAQRLADNFWSRWVKEYLPTLQPRGQPGGSLDLAVGDLVLIGDPTLPRNTWPRGRVLRTHPGPDGRIRVVDVDTAAGELRRRPVRRLVRLPTTDCESVAPK